MNDAVDNAVATEAVASEVPAERKIAVESPHVLALPNGKILVSLDQTGPDVKDQSGKKKQDARRRWMQGRVYASSDDGATWKLSATYPFRRATLFRDGGDVYLLGEASGALQLMRSPDGGGSWSDPMELAPGRELLASRLRLDGPFAPASASPGTWTPPEGLTLDEIEKRTLEHVLRQTNGNRSLTAERLGISRRTIQRKIQDYNLPF